MYVQCMCVIRTPICLYIVVHTYIVCALQHTIIIVTHTANTYIVREDSFSHTRRCETPLVTL